jgi:hypothetical protein
METAYARNSPAPSRATKVAHSSQNAPHRASLAALQRSAGNRAVAGMLQRALLSWTGSEWRVAHKGPLELVTLPTFPGDFVGQTYDTETEKLSSGWVKANIITQAQNCTDFAFNGDPDLALEPDLQRLLQAAQLKGYQRTTSGPDATVVLYGRNGNYSHAIKRLNGNWYEMTSLGGELRRYTGPENPPARHEGDEIVAMLKRAD